MKRTKKSALKPNPWWDKIEYLNGGAIYVRNKKGDKLYERLLGLKK